MYFLNGLESQIESVMALAASYGEIRDFSSLKRAYQRFLNEMQPQLPSEKSDELVFELNPKNVKAYQRAFGEDSILNDRVCRLSDESLDRSAEKIKTIESQWKLFQARFKAPASLFSLVMNRVFTSPSEEAGGGTVSAAIGILWLDPRPEWNERDYEEVFVHEMTHTLLFLDERRYQHYLNLETLALRENFALSAILAERRPLDKAVHSLVVATEILLLRHRLTKHAGDFHVHPPSSLLRERALRSADSILETMESLVTPRLKEIVHKCHMQLLRLEVRPRMESDHYARI